MNITCIYLYTYQINGNICNLLRANYFTRCTCFVFGSEIIHWACGCSNPPLSPFSTGIKVLKIINLVAILCSSIGSCEVLPCTHLYGTTKIVYGSLLYVVYIYYVGYLWKSYVLHSFESLCKAMWANHLLGECRCKLNLVSFTFFWCKVGCVLRALRPVELWFRRVGVELLKYKYMLNCSSCRSNL